LNAQLGRVDPLKGPEILILQWTARGPVVADKQGWTLVEGFDLGHDVITRAFLEWTSPEAKMSWGGN
jgi:hypothetical protein